MDVKKESQDLIMQLAQEIPEMSKIVYAMIEAMENAKTPAVKSFYERQIEDFKKQAEQMDAIQNEAENYLK